MRNENFLSLLIGKAVHEAINTWQRYLDISRNEISIHLGRKITLEYNY